MNQAVDSYVVSFETEHIRNQRHPRHHWMICSVQNSDELVAWGHAPTLALAKADAQKALEDLSFGHTQFGHVADEIVPCVESQGY